MSHLEQREPCSLCHGTDMDEFCVDRQRSYERCRRCLLVSVPKRFHLSAAHEKDVYDLHQNDPGDAGYRRFLGRVAAPLIERLTPGAVGLDFGCGPGPTLSLMLQEAGFPTDTFDLYYDRNASVFDKTYDFITATEVVEHLRDPKRELGRLYSMLAPGGVLAIMTKLVRGPEAFATWHYKNDRTHIAFFSRETFLWLARQWSAEVAFVGADVILLSSPES